MVIIRNWGWAGVGRNSGFLWNWGNVRGYEKKRHSARTRSLEQKFAFNFIKFHNRPENFLTFQRSDLFRTNMNHSFKMKTFFNFIFTTSMYISNYQQKPTLKTKNVFRSEKDVPKILKKKSNSYPKISISLGALVARIPQVK